MKVFHPNIHIVSNYMDFDEDVRQISFGLGMDMGWEPQPGHFTLNSNPSLGGEGAGGVLASVSSGSIYLFIFASKHPYF